MNRFRIVADSSCDLLTQEQLTQCQKFRRDIHQKQCYTDDNGGRVRMRTIRCETPTDRSLFFAWPIFTPCDAPDIADSVTVLKPAVLGVIDWNRAA